MFGVTANLPLIYSCACCAEFVPDGSGKETLADFTLFVQDFTEDLPCGQGIRQHNPENRAGVVVVLGQFEPGP
ncbi:MAG: hypothetical protein EBU49_14200, partial [Proteobacteria bacterium]|nr:hypothetical protein [Pseudomonadota bacterium]